MHRGNQLVVCALALLAGCGSWGWEKADGSMTVTGFRADNCACLGERVAVDTAVQTAAGLHDCRLAGGRSADMYEQCMTDKGYRKVWKSGSP